MSTVFDNLNFEPDNNMNMVKCLSSIINFGVIAARGLRTVEKSLSDKKKCGIDKGIFVAGYMFSIQKFVIIKILITDGHSGTNASRIKLFQR